MSPIAQRNQQAFARLAGEQPGPLYWREFFAEGSDTLPGRFRYEWQTLALWGGVADLQGRLRRLVGASPGTKVELASRSGSLFALAAKRLAAKCSRLLVADSLWPPYRRHLERVLKRSGTAFVRVRTGLPTDNRDLQPSRLADAVLSGRFDGLVAPLVDHHGRYLPLPRLVETARGQGHHLRTLVDASQAVGHVPMTLEDGWCDAMVAGSHKWLGGYNPLGFSLTSPPLTEGSTVTCSDPLYRFCTELTGGIQAKYGETAGVLPLLTASGALADTSPSQVARAFTVRLANKKRIAKLLRHAGWDLPRGTVAEPTGILVARPRRAPDEPPARVENRLASHRIVATVDGKSRIRFSMPGKKLEDDELERLARFAARCSQPEVLPAAG